MTDDGKRAEATQWSEHGDHDYVFVRKSPFERDDKACADCGQPSGGHGWIEGAETGRLVCPGDWIVEGVGEELAVYGTEDEAVKVLTAYALREVTGREILS